MNNEVLRDDTHIHEEKGGTIVYKEDVRGQADTHGLRHAGLHTHTHTHVHTNTHAHTHVHTTQYYAVYCVQRIQYVNTFLVQLYFYE